MPRIAISPCEKLRDYEEAVRRAGGEVYVLDRARDTPADVIAGVDGLVLTGGGDVSPSIYGEPAHPTYSPAEPGRDDYELELARRAAATGLPLLAICRGAQVLNVALGGTLVQDIPDQIANSLPHAVRDTPVTVAHDVWLADGSLLQRVLRDRLDGDTCPVNSRHHQAVQTLGRGLVVSATAPDGIVEAIEHADLPYCLGVQWHPENFYRTGEFRSLFEALMRSRQSEL